MTTKYKDPLMEHFLNPKNVGEMPDASGVGNVGNPLCGDIIRFFIKVNGDKIEKASFKTFGCRAAIATSSVLTQIVPGKTLPEALAISEKDIARPLGELPALKMHCARLAGYALKAAIGDYRARTTGDWTFLEEILERTRNPCEWTEEAQTRKKEIQHVEPPL